MTNNERESKFLADVESWNEVSAHRLPDGGLEVMFSHRATMDNAAVVRIRGDDIAFLHDDPDNAARLERTNTGGPWGEQ